MAAAARVGDSIEGGAHCHGHDHGLIPSPGTITGGASRTYIEGRPAAREGDPGHSPKCCGGIGKITIHEAGQHRVFIEGRPAAVTGSRTEHCGMAQGTIVGGSARVFFGEGAGTDFIS